MRVLKSTVRNCAILLAMCLFAALPAYAQAITIVVDPGHGGSDPGAIGVNGIYEKNVNRDVSVKLMDELERLGYDVVLTSDTDRNMSLQQRVDFKQTEQADLFVSIHANSHPSSSVQGSMVLYYDRHYASKHYPASAEMEPLTPLNKQLASAVANCLSDKAGTLNLGIVPSSVFVVRHGTMPSILVETAFLSNWHDAELLAQDSFRKKLAEGIAEGIGQFLPSGAFIDIHGHWAMDAILRMKQSGVIEGNNERFHPNRELTRAEFLTMADRVFHFSSLGMESSEEDGALMREAEPTITEDVYIPLATESPEMPHDQSFIDLSEQHWAYNVMASAIDQSILNGYTDGTVRPDAPITRAEVAALFDRIWSNTSRQVNIASEAAPFSDVPSMEWFTGSVYRLIRANLVEGTGGGRFEPERSMRRAEAVVLFDRYQNSIGERTLIQES